METLNTITTNFMVLWNAPKDWSLDGGLIWLTGYMVVVVISMALFFRDESRRNRKTAAYSAATRIAKARIARMERDGYIEKWNN
jgi:hypothetical protein